MNKKEKNIVIFGSNGGIVSEFSKSYYLEKSCKLFLISRAGKSTKVHLNNAVHISFDIESEESIINACKKFYQMS